MAPTLRRGSKAATLRRRVSKAPPLARHALRVAGAALGWHGPGLGAVFVPGDAGALRLCSLAGVWEPEPGMVRADVDPARLRAREHDIERFLVERLQLTMKSVRRLRPVSDGADFLGYIVRPLDRLVCRRVVGNLREKLDAFAREHIGGSGLRLPSGPREWLRAVLASDLGHFVHADAYRLVRACSTNTRGWINCFDRTIGRAAAIGRLTKVPRALGRIPARDLWRGPRRSRRRLFLAADASEGSAPGRQRDLCAAAEGDRPGGMKRRVLRYLFVGDGGAPWQGNAA